MHLSSLLTLVALTTAASAAVVTSAAQTTVNKGSLLGLLSTPNNKYSTSGFHRLVTSDGGYQPVIDILNNAGAVTVYIPNDKAIQYFFDRNLPNLQKGKYPAANAMVNNVTMLDLVKQHITTGRYATTSFNHPAMIKQSILTNKTFDTLGYGAPLLIDTNSTYSNFNDRNWRTQNAKNIQWNVGNGWASADILEKDVPSTNGYLNIIDDVITPPGDLKNTISHNSQIAQINHYFTTDNDIGNYIGNINNATIFLPNNKALNGTNLSNLSGDQGKQFIEQYIVPGIYYTTNLTEMAARNRGSVNLQTQSGEQLPVNYNSENFTVNNTASITTPNIFYNGGVIHIIDQLLSPVNTSDQSSTAA